MARETTPQTSFASASLQSLSVTRRRWNTTNTHLITPTNQRLADPRHLRARQSSRSTNIQRWEPPIIQIFAGKWSSRSHRLRCLIVRSTRTAPGSFGPALRLPYEYGHDAHAFVLLARPSTPQQYSNMGQYPYDNLRIPQTLDSNYISMSPHYEVPPEQSVTYNRFRSPYSVHLSFSPPLTHRVWYVHRWTPSIARQQRFSEPWLSYPGIQTPSPVPELPTESVNVGCAVQHSPEDLGCSRSSCRTDNTPLRTLRPRDNTSMMPLFSSLSSSISLGVNPAWDRCQGCDEQEVS
jgi:hypothetical protein